MALHVKLDELLRVSNEARNALIGAEQLPEKDIQELERSEEQEAAAAHTNGSGMSGSTRGNIPRADQ